MDDRRFDLLTRSLAGATNRRDFMRRLLRVAGLTGGVVALSTRETDAARRGFSGPKLPESQPQPGACNPNTGPCSVNADCCSGFCEQGLDSGNTCETCNGTICGEMICVNLQADPLNCGSCGHWCEQGTNCNGGQC